MARAVVLTLHRDERVAQFRLRVLNDESIHNHGAFAQLPWTSPAGGVAGRGRTDC
jgi:GTP cyclohydrolase I